MACNDNTMGRGFGSRMVSLELLRQLKSLQMDSLMGIWGDEKYVVSREKGVQEARGKGELDPRKRTKKWQKRGEVV